MQRMARLLGGAFRRLLGGLFAALPCFWGCLVVARLHLGRVVFDLLYLARVLGGTDHFSGLNAVRLTQLRQNVEAFDDSAKDDGRSAGSISVYIKLKIDLSAGL